MIWRLEQTCIKTDSRIVDAMHSLEESGIEIAMAVDDNHQLIGVLTDGDIRRALLSGLTLESPIIDILNCRFTSVCQKTSREEALDLMKARTIEQIPIVDADGKPVGLHLLHELISHHERPNWAIIMAGGKGTRLWPLTKTVPKPMLMVAGRPILERLVLHLVGFGIRRIFLSVNYLGEIIENHFQDGSKYGCEIEYLREDQPLGTGGPLRLLPKTELPLLIMNGDVVTQFDVTSFFETHEFCNNAATIGTRNYTHTVPFGCLQCENERVFRIEEKPTISNLINTGIYVIEPRLISKIPANQEFPITDLFIDCINCNERVGIFHIEDDWIDVGQREQLRLAREGGSLV